MTDRENIEKVAEIIAEHADTPVWFAMLIAKKLNEAGLLDDEKAPDNTLWLNGFKCVRPSTEFMSEVGAHLISLVGVPGKSLVEVVIP